MSKVDFFIFRHGQTDWNANFRLQGHTNIPLNELGKEQSRELAKRMTSLKIEVVLSSDLIRAQETANIVIAQSVPRIITKDLREAMLGDVEGMIKADVVAEYGIEAWNRWISMKEEDFHFNFANMEPKESQLNRALKFLSEFSHQNPHYKKIAVSTHGLIVRRLINYSQNSPVDEFILPNCGLYQLQFNRDDNTWHFISSHCNIE
jgi:broad specificity phosphatase PhoE